MKKDLKRLLAMALLLTALLSACAGKSDADIRRELSGMWEEIALRQEPEPIDVRPAPKPALQQAKAPKALAGETAGSVEHAWIGAA